MKLLVVIASYGKGNDIYLRRLVEEYRSMSFEVDVVVLNNVPKYVAEGVEIITIPRRRIPWTLKGTFPGTRNLRQLRQEYQDWKRHLDIPFAHKRIFADRLNDYDLFVYSEDDTLVTERNLRAFLSVSAVLPDNEIPGFLRFEFGSGGEINYPEVHGHFHWETSSVRTHGEHTLAVFTNEHAACYVATRGQLRRAIDSGGFLVRPHGGKYDLLCTAATDLYTQCGFEKLICISQLDNFLVHHLPNKYVGTRFGVNDGELRRQVSELLRIGKRREQTAGLFQTESKFPDRSYSKGYYEPVRQELVSGWPAGVQSILSIGSGSGLTESCLSGKGLAVAAIPLDEIIAGGPETKSVEIIDGDFVHAREKLEGREFNGLLLANVLHLVVDPAGILSSFSELVTPGGTCMAVVPNTSRLELNWRAMLGWRVNDRDMFQAKGVQRTSAGTVKSWFRSAGFQVERIIRIVRPHARKIDSLTGGLLNSWLAYEFIVTARKPLQSTPIRRPAELQRAELES